MSRIKTDTTFPDRVRFNWGYHDGASAVRNEWANPERNFGFAVGGPMDGMETVEQVIERHFDKVYARGWLEGFRDMVASCYTNNSHPAWVRCLADPAFPGIEQDF